MSVNTESIRQLSGVDLPEPNTFQQPAHDPPSSVQQGRLNVIEQVYYQAPKEQPSGGAVRFCHFFQSSEQPYRRVLEVGPDWQPLDCGWLKEASFIHIENTEGKGLQARPSEQQLAEIKGRVLEINFGYIASGDWQPETAFDEPPSLEYRPDTLVRPGQSIRFSPAHLNIMVRCKAGKCRCIFNLYPL